MRLLTTRIKFCVSSCVEMSDSGGSSPFLEDPVIETVKQDDKDEYRQQQEQIYLLETQLDAKDKEFKVVELQLKREISQWETRYKDTNETLMKNNKDLEEKNQVLRDKLEQFTLDVEQSTALDEKTKTLSSNYDILLSEKLELEKRFTMVETAYQEKIQVLEDKVTQYKIDQQSSQSLLKTYEDEIARQTELIFNLQNDEDNKKLDSDADYQNQNNMQNNNISNNNNNSNNNNSTATIMEMKAWDEAIKEHEIFAREMESVNMQQASEIKRLRLELSKRDNQSRTVLDKNDNIDTLEQENSKLTQYIETQKNELESCRKTIFQLDQSSKNFKSLNEELALERYELLDLTKKYEQSIMNLKKFNHELEQQKHLSFEESRLLREEIERLTNGKPLNGTSDNNFKSLANDYKNKTEDLTNELKKLNDQLLTTQFQPENTSLETNKKRRNNDNIGINYSKRLNELQVENIKKSKEMETIQSKLNALQIEYEKLKDTKEHKIRILQARDNPFAKDQIVKSSHLKLLKDENEALLKQISNGNITILDSSIPRAVYDARIIDIQAKEHEIFKINKKSLRLKEMFNRKSLEFISVIDSIMGFKIEFQHDKKVKLYSCFKPDKYLAIDLAQNTLKSNLNTVIHDWDSLLSHWVKEQGQIPCFLAQVTLLLHDISSQEQH